MWPPDNEPTPEMARFCEDCSDRWTTLVDSAIYDLVQKMADKLIIDDRTNPGQIVARLLDEDGPIILEENRLKLGDALDEWVLTLPNLEHVLFDRGLLPYESLEAYTENEISESEAREPDPDRIRDEAWDRDHGL